MKKLATIIAASFILFSCSESVESVDKSLEVNTNDAEIQQNVVSSDLSNDSNLNLNAADINAAPADLSVNSADLNTVPSSNAPQTIKFPDVNVPNPSLKPAVASTAKGLNPAHGQPNHRCDIAVGEPLSTPIKQAPVQNITPVAAPQNAPQVISTPTPTLPKSTGSAVGAKLNPPHGEPGHDCAIQVGAPLNK